MAALTLRTASYTAVTKTGVGNVGASTITVSDVDGIVVGHIAEGTGVAPGATVTGVVQSTKQVSLSTANIGNVNGSVSFKEVTKNSPLTNSQIDSNFIELRRDVVARATSNYATLSNVSVTSGAINSTSIGATTRSTGAFTTLTADGAATLTANIASTSTTSGTLVVTGGVGVSGKVTAQSFDGDGASLTNLNASNLQSGLVPTSRLASGSASSATFLRGDQTWATVVSGASITNDTTSNANYYPMWTASTSGAPSTVYISNSKLYFNPSTGTLNATAFNSLSDRNLKENIVAISDATSKVKELSGVEYTWKDNGKKSAGVIAQDLEQVLPDLVDTNEEGVKTVNYNGIIAYLIEANKQLIARVEALESK